MLRTSLAVLLTGVAISALVIAAPTPVSADETPPLVLINELSNGGPHSDSDTFFELRNWGSESVDLTGWHVYRCSVQGLRSNLGRAEADLTGVVLQPGELFTVSKIGMAGDAHVSQPLSSAGFGLLVQSPDGAVTDSVGVYPNLPWPTQSECTVGRNLPNSLDFAANESWQRVDATGDVSQDFVAATSTIAAPNRTAPDPRSTATVVVSELSSAGRVANDDEIVELLNRGDSPQEIGGWQLFRCTAAGRLRPDTLETVVPEGTVLAPGERWLIGGHGFVGDADARLTGSLGNVNFGVLLRDGEDRLVDRVSVSSYDDSACQDGDSKLPAILDAVANESYQKVGETFVVAERTPGAANAIEDTSVFRAELAYPELPSVAISELATDPTPEGMPAGSVQRNFVELGNYGQTAVNISGWSVRRCQADGTRAREVQFVVPNGTTLAPGAVYLAAREGTELAARADTTYPLSFDFLGTGVWVADANGLRVDSLGVYAENEMDASNVTPSACTKGAALTTYLPDRLLEESFQRASFTGVDVQDFIAAKSTPGELDLHPFADPTERVVTARPASAPASATLANPASAPARPTSPERPTVPELVEGRAPRALATPQPTMVAAPVLEAWSGITGTPLTARVGTSETALDPASPAPIADDAFGIPYQRFVLDASALAVGSSVGWSGTTVARSELQLLIWNSETNSWRLADAGMGDPVSLHGTLEAGEIHNDTVTILVQDGARTEPTMTTGRDGNLEDPEDYDLAITHITDTQYLSESYPEVYAQLVSWIADNRDDRKIAFATHTGDLIQNWVDPDQSADRATIEFERASAVQAILDDADVPNSVLPGNHDNKRGVTDDLFNEYFPPERYADKGWYGGSIAPGDNSANFSTFENSGARFLMLSLPYGYGEREIAWAEQIVTGHPDHNVVVSTHEHVMPKTVEESAHRSANSRWLSKGQELWERVIAPNRNVVAVLSGHFHGLGQLVTENAGGIDGHTVVELLADYQEFRTHTGERATGFYRMLQLDLDAGAIAVDTRSVRLAEAYSADYDYLQFKPDNGLATTISNARPWRIVEAGTQDRYTEEDDEFGASVQFQHPKLVNTLTVSVSSH